MVGEFYIDFVRSIREIYFIDEVELMENRVKRSFDYFMWYFEYCNRDFICRCVYNFEFEV